MPDWPGTPAQPPAPQWPGTPATPNQAVEARWPGTPAAAVQAAPVPSTPPPAAGAAAPQGRGIWQAIKDYPSHVLEGITSLPKRAIEASAEDVQHIGEPGRTELKSAEPAVEAALMTMGTGAGARPLRTAGAPVLEAARNASKVLEKIVSPETVDADAKAAVSAIREIGGKAARDTAQTEAKLEPAYRTVSAMPATDQRTFLDYVEGRSGKYAGREAKDPVLQNLADTMRDAVQARQKKLEALPSTEQMGFVEDYVSHAGLWRDPAKAQQFVAGFGGKEGSGKFTKGRTLPTIADGIAAGLEPTTTDPIALTMKYVTNADRYIATNEVFDTARNAGTVKYLRPGKAPPGWTEVKGRLGDKTTPAGPLKAYAPESWARIYNNFISRGFAEHGEEFGQAYEAARRGSNSITALELGLSGYHTLTMAQESMVNSVANAVGYARHGMPVEAAKSLGKAAIAPVGYAVKGKKIQDIYLGLSKGSKEMEHITDLLTEAGGRGKGSRHAPDYEFSKGGSYWTAFKRGQLKLQATADRAEAMGSPVGAAKVAARHIGRVMDTVAQPIFEAYIPKIKNAAFYENMAAWLKQHPSAPREEQVNAARQVWDSVDNRFGELVQDNIFINKVIKQIGMLSLRSWSWTVGGVVRELGGAVRDIARTPFKKPTGTGPQEGKWTQKMDYAIALPVVYGTLSAIYQALKTGKPPESIHDLLAPKTGGADASTGEPERLMMPGYMKDVFGFIEHPVDEITNKVATAPKMAGQLITNQDWRGDPIFPPDPSAPEWLKAFWNYASQNVGPISARSIAKGQKAGSNLSTPETLLGVRTAPRYLTDPEGYEQMMKSIRGRKWKDKERHDRKQQSLYEGD